MNVVNSAELVTVGGVCTEVGSFRSKTLRRPKSYTFQSIPPGGQGTGHLAGHRDVTGHDRWLSPPNPARAAKPSLGHKG